MCLAIAKPEGRDIPMAHLENGFINNPDGAGFTYVQEGELVVRKGFFTFADFLREWQSIDMFELSALVHFRWATHGKKNAINCHPWRIGHNLVAIHNGILPWRSSKKMSDTGYFVQDVLAPNWERLYDSKWCQRLEDFIGRGNKMAFLDVAGDISFLNEHAGTWIDGVWYSNTNHMPVTPPVWSRYWDTRLDYKLIDEEAIDDELSYYNDLLDLEEERCQFSDLPTHRAQS